MANHKTTSVITPGKAASATPNRTSNPIINPWKEASATANRKTYPTSHNLNQSTTTKGNVTPPERAGTIENRQSAVTTGAKVGTSQFKAQARNHVRSPPVQNPVSYSDLHQALAAPPLKVTSLVRTVYISLLPCDNVTSC